MIPSADSLFQWIAYEIRFKNFFLDSLFFSIMEFNNVTQMEYVIDITMSLVCKSRRKLAYDWKIEKLIKIGNRLCSFWKCWKSLGYPAVLDIKYILLCFDGKLNSQDNHRAAVEFEYVLVHLILCPECDVEQWKPFSPKSDFQVRDWTRNFNSIKFSASRPTNWKEFIMEMPETLLWMIQTDFKIKKKKYSVAKYSEQTRKRKRVKGRSLNDDSRGCWPNIHSYEL